MPDPDPAPGAVRLEGLDGLRGILSMSVLVAHVVGHLAPDSTAPLHLGLLGQAVVVFFTLSGFLIFLPFCEALLAGDRLPDVRRYAARRVARVYPAYVVVFLVANLAFGAVFVSNVLETSVPRDDAGTGRITNPFEVLLHLTLLQNLVPDQVQTGLNVSWSLTTELGFYLLVPLLALGAATTVRRTGWSAVRVLVGVIVTVTAVALAAKSYLTALDAGSARTLEDLTFGSRWSAVLAESTLALADVFAAGMVAALVFALVRRGGLTGWTGARLHRWGGAVVVIAGLAALVGLRAQSAFANTFLAVAAGALLVLVTVPAARGERSGLGRLLDVRPLRLLGDWSLSIYLWHFPVLVLVTRWGWAGPDTLPGALWSIGLVSAITIALSALSYRLVELPAMRFRRRPKAQEAAA